MGIRVHKTLGYGLTDVKTREYKIADGRINPKSPLHEAWNLKTEDYLAWLKNKYADKNKSLEAFNTDLWLTHSESKARLDDTIVYANEYGMKNVLLLKPLGCTNWSRYDDPIDYIEETFLRGGGPELNHVTVLEHGIFPYSSSYMNAKTGVRVKNDMDWVHANWPSMKGFWDLDELAKKLGFDNEADARKNFVPTVPMEIRDLAEWGKLFTSDDVWLQLRPMIYVHWS